jgi:TatA/E family protein of Tat protein translocase
VIPHLIASMPLIHLPIGLLPDIGGGEMMMIMFVVLLLFGGDKMPQFAKGLGKALKEFKKAANDVEQEIKRAIDEVPDTPDLKSTIFSTMRDKVKPVALAPVVATPHPTPASDAVEPAPQHSPAPAPATTPNLEPPVP